jgi:hypothetical protein
MPNDWIEKDVGEWLQNYVRETIGKRISSMWTNNNLSEVFLSHPLSPCFPLPLCLSLSLQDDGVWGVDIRQAEWMSETERGRERGRRYRGIELTSLSHALEFLFFLARAL